MATTTKPKAKLTTTAKGLGWRHRQAAAALRGRHKDGSPCEWCDRPMWLDRTRNWDYKPDSTNPANGSLHADHSEMSRNEAIRRGVPIPLPNRLLHGVCNIQRGDGGNDHLAASNTGATSKTTKLAMPWPW